MVKERCSTRFHAYYKDVLEIFDAMSCNNTFTADKEVLEYLDGLEVPDFSSTLYHVPMKMDYKFSK